tara:strand:+ start:2372 stop:3109 length:738 start_codon:yes stop_codon:yes gene_type:complete
VKILLLVYGEYRSADIATKTWNILNSDVDVVVRTQNESNERVVKDNLYINKKISETDIKNIFGDCEIYLESLDEYTRSNPNNDVNLNIRDFRYLYTKVSHKIDNYDLVLISRLDSTFYIHDLKKFMNEYDKETIYVTQLIQKSKNGNFIQDHCYFGSSKVIGSFLKNLPDEVIDSHHEIADYILENFKHDVWKGFSSIHLRLNMNKLFEKYFSVNESCKNKDDNYLNFFTEFMRKKHTKLESEIK